MPETTQFNGLDNKASFDGALKPNTVLQGRYEILAVMGGGGQGAVYQARDRNFTTARRLVAVKEMHVIDSDPNQRAANIRTFQREANLLATLSHPAIPKIYDYFDLNDRAYIVMEYINGSDLEALLVKTKRLPMDKIIEWAIDLCDVLYYLHSYQPEPIVFRDMKPANIMIDSLGKVRLIDFGIAKIFDRSTRRHTQIGTEGYSAPEQYRGLVTPLSDIYGLGATLHHIITREDPRLHAPFTFAERPLMKYNHEATAELAAIVDRAVSTEQDNRFPNLLEMKLALERIRFGVVAAPSPANPATKAPGTPAPPADAPASSTGFIDEDAPADTGIKPRWTFKTEDEIRGGAIAHNGVVYVGSYDTNLWAINLESGAFLWKRATEGGIVSTPAIDLDSNQIVFGSEDYQFLALDLRTGRPNWTFPTNDKIRSSGRVAHGHIFFGSDDGKLYAIKANNGRLMWSFDAGAPVRSTPFVTNDRVIFGADNGEVIGLELNGSKKWSYKTRKPITATPFVDADGLCYVCSWDNFLYALDAANGYSHWRFRTNNMVVSSPVVVNNIVYVTSTDGRVYAINAQTSKERWTFDAGRPLVATPTITNDAVYVGATDGNFYCLDLRTGREMWRYKTNGPITAAACIAGHVILIGSSDATLYAFPMVKR